MARLAGYRKALTLWSRNYAFPPRYRRDERRSVVTADGVRLRVAHVAGPPDASFTVVLAHGFLNSSRAPRIFTFARLLAERAHVFVPDLRGHGASEGVCTFGWSEPLDIAAVVAAAPPGLPVVTVGTSLGGAAVILHAGAYGGVAGVVAISAPAWWGSRERPGADRVHRLVASRGGRRLAAALLRTRIRPCTMPGEPGGPALTLVDPDDMMARIAPAFTIVVHDPADHYFGPEHAQHLYDHCQEPKALWWYEGAGHGTDLLTPAFAERLLAELPERVEEASSRKD